MGSATYEYEWMLRHFANQGRNAAAEWPYSQPCWVFNSRELPLVEGANLHFVRGDIRPVYESMYATADEKNLWLMGGGDLVGQFYDTGLLDEIIAQIGSVTLGSGKPFLPRQIAFPPLKLTSPQQFRPGLAELRYDGWR